MKTFFDLSCNVLKKIHSKVFEMNLLHNNNKVILIRVSFDGVLTPVSTFYNFRMFQLHLQVGLVNYFFLPIMYSNCVLYYNI